MSCAPIPENDCFKHWKRNQREVCFGNFPEAGFFCYTELLKSIPQPLSGPPGVWALRPFRAFGALRPFRMLCEHMRTEQEKGNGISEYFV